MYFMSIFLLRGVPRKPCECTHKNIKFIDEKYMYGV